MFCEKCGYEHSDNTVFCPQCGARIAPEKFANQSPKSTQPMAKAEYFATCCSINVQKKNKLIKTLSIVCLGIQGVLNILAIISIYGFVYALQQSPLYEGRTSGIWSPVIFALFFTAGSFAFTLLGTKKNSTGFFVWATIFAFISTAFGCIIFGLGLRRLIALGILAVYIVITVLNHQCNKEYKEYTSLQKRGTAQ